MKKYLILLLLLVSCSKNSEKQDIDNVLNSYVGLKDIELVQSFGMPYS